MFSFPIPFPFPLVFKRSITHSASAGPAAVYLLFTMVPKKSVNSTLSASIFRFAGPRAIHSQSTSKIPLYATLECSVCMHGPHAGHTCQLNNAHECNPFFFLDSKQPRRSLRNKCKASNLGIKHRLLTAILANRACGH